MLRRARRTGRVARRLDVQRVGEAVAQPLERERRGCGTASARRTRRPSPSAPAARGAGPAGGARATVSRRCRTAARPGCSPCWRAGRPGPPLPVKRHSSSSSGIRHDRDTTSMRSSSAAAASSPREDGTGADYGRAPAHPDPLVCLLAACLSADATDRRSRRAPRRRTRRSNPGPNPTTGDPGPNNTVERPGDPAGHAHRDVATASSSTATRPTSRSRSSSSCSTPRTSAGRASSVVLSGTDGERTVGPKRHRSTSPAAADRGIRPVRRDVRGREGRRGHARPADTAPGDQVRDSGRYLMR